MVSPLVWSNFFGQNVDLTSGLHCNNKFKFQINSATSFDFDMFYYVAGVFALFFCVDVYYFLRGLVIFVIALIRPKRQGMQSFKDTNNTII